MITQRGLLAGVLLATTVFISSIEVDVGGPHSSEPTEEQSVYSV